MDLDHSPHQQMLATIPGLRAFAISLTGSVDQADDLVQAALLKGLENIARFQPGTSMKSWLFTILRNHFYTELRRSRRELEDPDGALTHSLAVTPEQGIRLDYADMVVALGKLTIDQREALLLVAAEGVSYDQAARICGTNIGTIKSRVNRGRARLAEILALDEEEDFGTEQVVRAALLLHHAC
jgi:RNA polymerase sigma-70 factor (ECF subfamily)